MGSGKLKKTVEEEVAAPATQSNLKETLSGDEFDVTPMLMATEENGDGDGWEVTAGGFYPRRQEDNTKNLSDDV
jgi:hypothetical protein